MLFDALEKELASSPEHRDLITRLYQGTMMDYVKCLECYKESSGEETYLDIPLAIRSFGKDHTYRRVVSELLGLWCLFVCAMAK